MAKEQWKKIGIIVGITSLAVTVLGSVIGIAWAGSGKFTAYDKDFDAVVLKVETTETRAFKAVEVVAGNQKEDRVAIRAIADIVTGMQDEHDEDYKELKQGINDSRLRDERIATQYSVILNHMQQQTDASRRTDSAVGSIQVDIGKLQTQYKTLVKD